MAEQSGNKFLIIILTLLIGVSVPLASWFYFRMMVTDKALTIKVQQMNAVRDELNEELKRLKAAREAEKGSK